MTQSTYSGYTSKLDKLQVLLNHAQLLNEDLFNDDINELRDLYARDIKRFFVDFWLYAGTGNDLVQGYAIDALADILPPFFAGEFHTLIVTMPPREGKSTLLSVMTPAYLWTLQPRLRFLSISYAHSYAMRDNMYMQKLIKHKTYQRLWGKYFSLTIENRERTYNTADGQRVATSIGGRVTGEGADLILLDDLNNVSKMGKENAFNFVNETIDNVILHRTNNAATAKFLLFQHRSGQNDAVAHFLSKNDPGTVFMCLPMEYEKSRHCSIISPKTKKLLYTDPRTEDGQLLSPLRYPGDTIKRRRANMGSWAYESLFQCNPIPAKGKVFSKDWFRVWSHAQLPKIEFVIQCWDTALSVTPDACYSACSSYGMFVDKDGHNSVIHLSTWTGKLEWNDLRKMMVRLAKNFYDTDYHNPIEGEAFPNLKLVEAKGNGKSLVQSLNSAGLDFLEYNPNRQKTKINVASDDAKVMRARLISSLVENGRVYVRAMAPSFTTLTPAADELITSAANFPSNIGANKDLIDTFSMCLNYLTSKHWLKSLEEMMQEEYVATRNIKTEDIGWKLNLKTNKLAHYSGKESFDFK